MPDDFPENDPRKIWQDQPTESSVMTLEKIRQKMQRLHTKTRRQIYGSLAGPLVAAFFYGFAMKQLPRLSQMLQMVFVLALAWSLAGLYFLNRGMRPAVMPADAGFSTGLEFCRREIERRRYFLRRVLLWSFGPVMLAIGTFILALAMIVRADRGVFPNGVPFLTLVVVWVVGYFVVRLREQRELRREIDELNEIERENSR
jgi:hypothetical protein